MWPVMVGVWRREMRTGTLLYVTLLLIGAAIVLGRLHNQLAALSVDRMGARELALLSSAPLQFVPALWLLMYVMLPLRLVLQLARDHERGWTAPLFAAGHDRPSWVAGVYVAELSIAIAILGAALTVNAIIRSTTVPVREALHGLPWGVLAVTCCAAFTIILFCVLRAADQVILAAILLIALPSALNLMLALRSPDWVPLSKWLTMHVPPVSLVPTPRLGLATLFYRFFALPLLLRLVPRRIGWWG